MSTFTSSLPSSHLTHLLSNPTIILPSLATLSTIFLALSSTIFISLLTLAIYRLYLHPLSRYPGPLLAKLTPLHASWHAYKGDRHLVLYRMHQKYGPIVRWGPNSISINSVAGLKEINGHGANARNVQKSEFYKAFPAVKGVHNTHNAIDKSVHGRKRRVLSAAFSDNALKGLESLVLKNVDVFFGEIERRMTAGKLGELKEEDGVFTDTKTGKKGLDMGEMVSWLTFDVMGNLCFGQSFDILVNKGQRFITELIDKTAHNHYICGNYLPLRTLKIGNFLFPTISADRWKFILHSRACANERMKMAKEGRDEGMRDFFHFLLEAKDPETGEGFETVELWGEANVLMIAGSDTTSTAMAAAMFYLTKHPKTLKRLQDEVRSRFTATEEIVQGQDLLGCAYLRAVINEAMRLCPPVPGLLPREVTNPKGMTIQDPEHNTSYYLPQGTVCGTPIYAIHHNEAYYPDPFAFRPERWLTSAELSALSIPESEVADLGGEAMREKALAAYTPFGIGARGCIGKGLALMELRIVVGRMAYGWEVEQVEVEGKGVNWKEGWGEKEGEFRMLDHFTARKEGPVVEWRRRVGA